MSGDLEPMAGRVALRDLVSRYALAVDDRDIATLVGLFAPDACFRAANGNFRADGIAEIEPEFRRQLGGLGPSFHVVHDHVVDFDATDGDKATGVVTAHAEVWRQGALWLTAIRYRDRYVRIDGRWRFAERALGFLYYVPAADYARTPGDAMRFMVGGTTKPADWPEPGATWTAFYAGG